MQKPDSDPTDKGWLLRLLIRRSFDNDFVLNLGYYGYGFGNYVSDNPDHFTRVMRKLYNAVLNAALDGTVHSSIVGVFFGHPAHPDMRVPLEFVEIGSKLLVRHDLYEQIVDNEMLSKAYRVEFNVFYRELEEKMQQQFQVNEVEFLFKRFLDPYFLEKTETLKSEDTVSGSKSSEISDIVRQNLQEGFNRVIDLVKRRIPEEVLSQSENFPGVLENAIKLRYFEVSDLYNPPISQNSAAIIGEILNQLLSAMEQLQDDSPFRNFLANIMDFDGFFRAAEFAGLGIDSLMRRVVENSSYFSKLPRKKFLKPYSAKAYISRRKSLINAFTRHESSRVKDMNAKSVFSILELGPIGPLKNVNGRSATVGEHRIADEQRSLYRTFLKTRVHRWFFRHHAFLKTGVHRWFVRRWFEAFGDDSSKREQLIFMLQKISQELILFRDPIDMEFVFIYLKQVDPRITKFDFFFGYVQFLEASATSHDYDDPESSINTAYRYMARFDSLKDINHLSTREKLQLIKIKIAGSPRASHDFLLDRLFEIKDSDPQIQAFFEDEELIGKLFYESSKRKYAIHQLNQKYKISDVDMALRAGQISPPGVRQERQIVFEIQATLDKQFPGNSYVKDGVLNYIEESIRTSQVETRKLNSSRMGSGLSNWHETPGLFAIDIPDFVNSHLESSFDRKQLLEYLIGIRRRFPEFMGKRRSSLDERSLREMVNFRRGFVQAHPLVRSMVLQPLFDKDIGILSELEITEEVNRIILGEKYDEPLLRRLFEAYLDAVPAAEQKVIYSYIMSSFVDSPVTSRGASLKTILEAMGPFGIKAGQFLSTSGLIPGEYSRDLKDFLSNALPPERPRVIKDLERALGEELRGLVSIDDRAGSGSINYVQGVTAQLDGQSISAVARIRRDYIEGIVANENEVWMNAVDDLRASGDSMEANMADIVEEARRQSMSTLSVGGIELNLSIERDNFGPALQTYQRRIHAGRLRGWQVRVAIPNEGLQNLVEPDQQRFFSFYERINHTPLDDMGDIALREEIAKAIVESELIALFENGIYDPDGHPGNWPVDVENKRDCKDRLCPVEDYS